MQQQMSSGNFGVDMRLYISQHVVAARRWSKLSLVRREAACREEFRKRQRFDSRYWGRVTEMATHDAVRYFFLKNSAPPFEHPLLLLQLW